VGKTKLSRDRITAKALIKEGLLPIRLCWQNLMYEAVQLLPDTLYSYTCHIMYHAAYIVYIPFILFGSSMVSVCFLLLIRVFGLSCLCFSTYHRSICIDARRRLFWINLTLLLLHCAATLTCFASWILSCNSDLLLCFLDFDKSRDDKPTRSAVGLVFLEVDFEDPHKQFSSFSI